MPESVSLGRAVVVHNSKKNADVLYVVGMPESFLNTHERDGNHGRPGFDTKIIGFQHIPKNNVVMVKGEYVKDGVVKKLSKIVGTLAKDQSKASAHLKEARAPAPAPRGRSRGSRAAGA